VAREHSATRYLHGRALDSADDLLAFLRLTDFYGYRIPWNDNASIANDYTIHTLVFDGSSGSVLFSWGVAYAPLMEVKRFNLADDTLVSHAPADPLLEDPRYAWFMSNVERFQLRMLAGDRAWVDAHTDFDQADPFLVNYSTHTWRDGGKLVSRGTRLWSAERLISAYPDYHLPYAIKAALLEEDDPAAAISLYGQALQAKISFVPDRIASLAKVARLQRKTGNRREAASTAATCLAILEEMERKYRLDRWVLGIREEMRALAD